MTQIILQFHSNNNLLLVGSPLLHSTGGAWLFDLNQPESDPFKLTVTNAYLGSNVALNEKFAVVSDLFGEPMYDESSQSLSKTLIRAIGNDSTTIIDSYGEVSLSDDILAILRYHSGFEYYNPPLLEVFRLDDNAQPKLIMQRRHSLIKAWVQNGFLIIVQPNNHEELKYPKGIKICLELLESLQQKI